MLLSPLKSRLKLQVASAISALIGMITLGTIVYKFLEGN
jgi:hypothetical protein